MTDFEAPELPTRAERGVERLLQAIDVSIGERDYEQAMKAAQRLVIELHAMALLGRQGVDAIPVDAWDGGPTVRKIEARRAMASGNLTVTPAGEGDDAPAGAGHAVQAERG